MTRPSGGVGAKYSKDNKPRLDPTTVGASAAVSLENQPQRPYLDQTAIYTATKQNKYQLKLRYLMSQIKAVLEERDVHC